MQVLDLQVLVVVLSRTRVWWDIRLDPATVLDLGIWHFCIFCISVHTCWLEYVRRWERVCFWKRILGVLSVSYIYKNCHLHHIKFGRTSCHHFFLKNKKTKEQRKEKWTVEEKKVITKHESQCPCPRHPISHNKLSLQRTWIIHIENLSNEADKKYELRTLNITKEQWSKETHLPRKTSFPLSVYMYDRNYTNEAHIQFCQQKTTVPKLDDH